MPGPCIDAAGTDGESFGSPAPMGRDVPSEPEDVAGEEAQVSLKELTDGARRLKGILRGVEQDNVMLETDKGMRTIPLAAIDKARLVPKIDWRKGK